MFLERHVVGLLYVLSFGVCFFSYTARGAPESVSQALFSRSEYALFFLLVALAAATKQGDYYFFTKPLPILMLIFKTMDSESSLILYGLLFGLVGDLVLVFYWRWRGALIVGAWSFLFGHVCYGLAYAVVPISMGRSLWVTWLGLFVIFMHEYFYFMKQTAPFLEFFFGLFYWTAISLMMLAAANAQHFFWYEAGGGFPFAFLGGFCFVLSDFCVHWSIYVQPNQKIFDKLILPLYYVSQLFIVSSAPALAAFAK